MTTLPALLLVAMLLAGCGFLQPLPNQDPAAPGMADDTAPIGPVVEVGRGETVHGEFRYLVWESRMGTCTKVEYADDDGPMSCGGTLRRLLSIELSGVGGGTGGWDVEGLASDEIAELWLHAENGARVPVPLLPLATVGHDGQVFYTAVAEEMRPVRLVGLDADGEVIAEVPIETREPPPPP